MTLEEEEEKLLFLGVKRESLLKSEPKIVVPRVGWWATHKFHKRVVSQDVLRFCGWKKLKEYVNDSDYLIVKGLRATIFESGGRAKEVLTLRQDQFNFDEKGLVVIEGMKVMKSCHIRKGKAVKSKVQNRTVPIWLSDPLTQPMIDWWKTCREGELLFPYKYGWLYKHVVTEPEGTDPVGFFPHRLRAERARQLIKERKFTVHKLMAWFGWVKSDTAMEYTRMSAAELIEEILRGRM